MDVYLIASEIDTRLKTITGLRGTAIGTNGPLQVPGAVQYLPDRIDFDQTYGRGHDTATDWYVVVFLPRNDLRSAVKEISNYLKGTGAKSIKRVLDSATAPYTNAFDVQVVSAETDYNAQVEGATFLAAIFSLTVTGPGTV